MQFIRSAFRQFTESLFKQRNFYESNCKLFIVDAGHLLCGFLPLPLWARGSYTCGPSGDPTNMAIAVGTFYDESTEYDIGLGRYEYDDTDANGNGSVIGYGGGAGHQGTADLRLPKRYLKIRYEASGYLVSGTGAVDNPWVFTPWTRTCEAEVEKHSGLISLLEASVDIDGDTDTYTRTLNTTTGAYAETGSAAAVAAAVTDFPSWSGLAATADGVATAEIGEHEARLQLNISNAIYPGTGQPAGDTIYSIRVVMDEATVFELEDALQEAEALLDQVDHTRAGNGSYQVTINGSAQTVRMNTRLVVGWSGWPLAARIQSYYYPPVTPSVQPSTQDDSRLYPARRTFNWSFPNSADEDVPDQATMNTLFSDASLPTYFFNNTLGGALDSSRLGIRLAKGCVTTEGDRVCANTMNQEPPVPNTAWPTDPDNGSFFDYNGIEDCVRNFAPGASRVCVDPADLIFQYARMQLWRRCFNHAGAPACCDMGTP